MSKPDWDHWLRLRAVKLWQACALSRDIDPQRLGYGPSHDRRLWTFSPDKAFCERLDILLSYIGDARLPLLSIDERNKVESTVGVREFANWAINVARWKIPDALARLAPNEGSASEQEGSVAQRPESRQRWQEDEILRIIGALGNKATALAKQQPGKPGVKAAVRSMLKGPSWTASKFEKAWQRLRVDGRIKEKT